MGPGKLQRPHPPLDSEEYRKSPGEAGPPRTLRTQPGAPGSGRSRPLPPGVRKDKEAKKEGLQGDIQATTWRRADGTGSSSGE